MRTTVKNVTKSVQNQWIKNKWVRAPYNVSGMQQMNVLLIWYMWMCASAIAYLSYPGPMLIFSYFIKIEKTRNTPA